MRDRGTEAAESLEIDATASQGDIRKPVRERQPVATGQILEVELGPESSIRKERRPKDVGWAGKPRRRRWRRGSDDLRRDGFVEALMKENKCLCSRREI